MLDSLFAGHSSGSRLSLSLTLSLSLPHSLVLSPSRSCFLCMSGCKIIHLERCLSTPSDNCHSHCLGRCLRRGSVVNHWIRRVLWQPAECLIIFNNNCLKLTHKLYETSPCVRFCSLYGYKYEYIYTHAYPVFTLGVAERDREGERQRERALCSLIVILCCPDKALTPRAQIQFQYFHSLIDGKGEKRRRKGERVEKWRRLIMLQAPA